MYYRIRVEETCGSRTYTDHHAAVITSLDSPFLSLSLPDHCSDYRDSATIPRPQRVFDSFQRHKFFMKDIQNLYLSVGRVIISLYRPHPLHCELKINSMRYRLVPHRYPRKSQVHEQVYRKNLESYLRLRRTLYNETGVVMFRHYRVRGQGQTG